MALSMSVHVTRRELRLAEAWLRKEMTGEAPEQRISPIEIAILQHRPALKRNASNTQPKRIPH